MRLDLLEAVSHEKDDDSKPLLPDVPKPNLVLLFQRLVALCVCDKSDVRTSICVIGVQLDDKAGVV